MPLGNTSRVQLRLKPEATLGTVPGTGNHYALRFTNEALKYALQTTQSQEIRSDRQVTDLPLVGASVEGSLGFEWSYGEFDSILDAALQGAWSVLGTNGAATGTATFTSTSVVLTGAGSPFTNAAVGQWFRVTGAAQAGNNAWHKVASVPNATTLTVASGMTAETGTTGVQVQGARLTNGTTFKSLSIERLNSDLSVYSVFRGCAPSRLQLNMALGGILTGQFDMLGMDSASTGSSYMPGTTVASLTNNVYNSVSNVFNILEGGAALSGTYMRSLTINVDNNLRAQGGIGVLGNVGIGSGAAVVTGQMELYFANTTMYNKFVQNTASSISVRVSSGASGIGYVLTFPNIKYSDGGFPTPGINQDVILQQPFQALRDSTTGAEIIIDRGGDAVTPWAS